MFALLLLIFQYMNQKSIYDSQENQNQVLRQKVEKLEGVIQEQNERILELNYFSLQGNENAMTYLENSGQDPEALETYISEWIYDQNLVAESNPLVPFEGMYGGMKVNKVRFLNHRWILADFTDSVYWGEMLLEYSINDEGGYDFHTLGSLMYPEAR